MRFPNMMFGGLLGAVPGVLLIAIGQIVTNGGEVMLEIGMGGVLLTLAGLIVGAVLGGQKSGWLNGQGVLGAAIGLVPGVIVWQIDWDLEIVALTIVAGSLLVVSSATESVVDQLLTNSQPLCAAFCDSCLARPKHSLETAPTDLARL